MRCLLNRNIARAHKMGAPPKSIDKEKIGTIIRSLSTDKNVACPFAWGQQHPGELLREFSVKGVGKIAVPVSELVGLC